MASRLQHITALVVSAGLGLASACTSQGDSSNKPDSADQTGSTTPPPPPPDDGSAVVPVPVALLAGAFLTQFQIGLSGGSQSTAGAVNARSPGAVAAGNNAAAASVLASVLVPRLALLTKLENNLFGPTGPFKGQPLTVTAGKTTLYSVPASTSVWTSKAPAIVAVSMATGQSNAYPVSVDVRCSRPGSDTLELCLHYGLSLLPNSQALVQLRFFDDEEQEATPLFVWDLAYDTRAAAVEGQFGEEPPTTLDADHYAFQVVANSDSSRIDLRAAQYYLADSAGDWFLPYVALPFAGDILLARYRIAPSENLSVLDQAYLSGAAASGVGQTVAPSIFQTNGLLEFMDGQAIDYLRGPTVSPACATLGDQLAAAATGLTTPARLPANICASTTTLTDATVLTYVTAFCQGGTRDITIDGLPFCELFDTLPTISADRVTIDLATQAIEPGTPSSTPLAAQLAAEMAAEPFPLRVGYYKTQSLPVPDQQPKSAFAGAQAPP